MEKRLWGQRSRRKYIVMLNLFQHPKRLRS